MDDCNKTACGLVDRTKEEVVGVGLADELILESDREAAKGAVSQAVDAGSDTDAMLMSVLPKGGGEVAVTSDVGPRRCGSATTGSMVPTWEHSLEHGVRCSPLHPHLR